VKLRRLKKIIKVAICNLMVADNNEDVEYFDNLLLDILKVYFDIKINRFNDPPPLERRVISLANCDETFCDQFLRFKKPDIGRLFQLLHFPDIVRFDNRSTMSGEEVFIRGLYEMASGEKKESIAVKFGRHSSDQCRAFTFFINHIYENFHHLVDNNLQWWFDKGLVEESARLIQDKMGLTSGVHNVFAMFIDCNCLETSRPGGGPMESGANSKRWHPDVQRAYKL